jgi:hypothetical protein
MVSIYVLVEAVDICWDQRIRKFIGPFAPLERARCTLWYYNCGNSIKHMLASLTYWQVVSHRHLGFSCRYWSAAQLRHWRYASVFRCTGDILATLRLGPALYRGYEILWDETPRLSCCLCGEFLPRVHLCNVISGAYLSHRSFRGKTCKATSTSRKSLQILQTSASLEKSKWDPGVNFSVSVDTALVGVGTRCLHERIAPGPMGETRVALACLRILGHVFGSQKPRNP